MSSASSEGSIGLGGLHGFGFVVEELPGNAVVLLAVCGDERSHPATLSFVRPARKRIVHDVDTDDCSIGDIADIFPAEATFLFVAVGEGVKRIV